jgi:hypothetical protein
MKLLEYSTWYMRLFVQWVKTFVRFFTKVFARCLCDLELLSLTMAIYIYIYIRVEKAVLVLERYVYLLVDSGHTLASRGSD